MNDRTTLRPARVNDAGWTHILRNMPHIREASLDRSEIPLEVHVVWWTAALADPNRRLCIIVHDGEDAGVLRLDRTGDAAEVSIYTRPGLAGRGVGRQAILAGVALARGQLGVYRLVATIRPTNVASQRAFAAAGFVKGENGWTRLA